MPRGPHRSTHKHYWELMHAHSGCWAGRCLRACTRGLRSVHASLIRGAGILGSWGIRGSYQAQGVLVLICSRLSISSRPPCPRRPLLSNSNLHCAGERHEGGRGPTQLALCRDTCINKPASNTHNSMEGTVGAFAIPVSHRGSFCLSWTQQT